MVSYDFRLSLLGPGSIPGRERRSCKPKNKIKTKSLVLQSRTRLVWEVQCARVAKQEHPKYSERSGGLQTHSQKALSPEYGSQA